MATCENCCGWRRRFATADSRGVRTSSTTKVTSLWTIARRGPRPADEPTYQDCYFTTFAGLQSGTCAWPASRIRSLWRSQDTAADQCSTAIRLWAHETSAMQGRKWRDGSDQV